MLLKNKVAITFLLFFNLFLHNALAQNKLDFEIGLTNLPNQIEGNMIRDHEGFLWFCYYGGIGRYDSYEVKYFKAEENMISGPATQSIVIDHDGVLWILTKNNGLNKYNKETDSFTHFKHEPGNSNSLNSNFSEVSSPQKLFVDNQNRILIGTSGGFDIYNKKSEKFYHYIQNNDDENSLSNNNVSTVIQDNDGEFWIGTLNDGLNKYNENENKWIRYQTGENPSINLLSNKITSLVEDSFGNIWIGTGDKGISVYNKKTKTFTHFQHDPLNENSLADNNIYFLYEDSSKNIWITHNNSKVAGIEMYDRERNQFIRYSSDSENSKSISSNFVSSVYEDPISQIFWVIHTLDGVFDKYDRFNWEIGVHKYKPSNANSLSSSQALVMMEDRSERMWISVDNALNLYDKKNGKYTHYFYDLMTPYGGPFTVAMCQADGNKIWLLSSQGVFSLFNTESGIIEKSYRNTPSDTFSIMASDSTGGAIIQDKNNKNILWLALSGGVDRFDIQNETFTHYIHDPDDGNTITPGQVWSLYDDGKGYLWISTFDGLNLLNKSTKQITRFINNPDNPDSIGFNRISSVFEDSFGNLWITGFTKGMDLYDRNTNIFRHFNIETGFPVIGINQTIQEDNSGNLWIGTTDNGLIKFNIEKKEIAAIYSTSDGFQDNNFRRSYKTNSGEMWFSSKFGVNNFFPDLVNKNNAIPPVFLTSFKPGNNNITDLEIAPEKLKEITLSWKENFFEFQFAVLNYTNPEDNKYAYMLVGRDNEWFYSDINPSGRYSGLNGGQYTLRLKGSNNDGVWNNEGYSLLIKIIPPFWKSKWFYSFLLLLIIFIVFLTLIYFSKLKHEINERKQAEKAFRDSEKKYRILIENAPDLRYRTDLEGIITFVSQSCFKMSGYKVEELIGTIAADYLFFDVTQNRVFLKEISIHGYVDSYESKLKKKDGSTWWASTNAHYYKNIYGKILGVEGVTRDITAKKQVEIELQSFKNYLSNIIDSMPSILVGVNALGEVTFWNKTAEVATGITTSMAQGKSLTEVFPIMAPEMEKIKESIHTRQVKLEQNRSRKKGDEILFEDITIYPLITNGVEGAVIRVDDVTNQFRLHEIMIQSEKMLSVGGLAAGMAHEINNPLAGMLQTANVMSSRLNISRKNTANKEAAEKAGTTLQVIESYMELRGIPSMIEKINESGRRIAAIVNNMLSFARKSEDVFSTYDIPFLLDKTLKLAETDYDFKKQYDFKQINILKEYAENIPHLPCDISKIQQVFLNILRNGAQAMQSAKISDPQLIIRVFIKDNEKKLTIEIEDNGPGISNEIKSKIFEPFFTTKPIGVGTGLGLSVSYFIITETHNGDLYVESNNDRGSKFIIKLPI